MEKIKVDGLAKSIGVSNFGVDDLKDLLSHATVLPAVNQILFHPYVWKEQAALHEFGNTRGIATEAYSALTPITHQPGGPLDGPLNDISMRRKATPDQVLLAWVKAKGAVAVTYSSKADRLNGYMRAGDLELTTEEVATLDAAGSQRSCKFLRVMCRKENGFTKILLILFVLLAMYSASRCVNSFTSSTGFGIKL